MMPPRIRCGPTTAISNSYPSVLFSHLSLDVGRLVEATACDTIRNERHTQKSPLERDCNPSQFNVLRSRYFDSLDSTVTYVD